MKTKSCISCIALIIIWISCARQLPDSVRIHQRFNTGWKFHLGDVPLAHEPGLDDADWRVLHLPHDWSIEGEFKEEQPAGAGGGALPGGIGWYRKKFDLPGGYTDKQVFIGFDGVYQESEVWLNGHYLGKRPNGYISFRYHLTPYLNDGTKENVLAVKVNNANQPNSRWYTGSGIYRNVWLTVTGAIHVDHWGTYITTPDVHREKASVVLKTSVRNSRQQDQPIVLKTVIRDADGQEIAAAVSEIIAVKDTVTEIAQEVIVANPILWSVDHPYLYRAVSRILYNGQIQDDYKTTFGIRTFVFDSTKGFLLNGKQLKIRGVCNHHDLGCLGSAVHTRALERQLELLKEMGCNGIRTAHNPPAPELLDLCDRMGFIIMDEAFDMWKKGKNRFDYHLYWDEWHRRDLADFILRDRNHPCVFIWSIGNEILEQWDSSGVAMARELAAIVKNLDPTRPVTSACNDPNPWNHIIKSGALDIIGYNYHHNEFLDFKKKFPGQLFIAAETGSAIATRGAYDMPSDSIRVWPERWDRPVKGNPDYTCSAYDNCRVGWGSTHEDTWQIIKKHDFLSGMYIWTGFDYLGEPTPYGWPARSSYFGIIDLAGFPKDAYYLYRSEWTDKPVLHIFPHWNWQNGDTVDIWAYTNYTEVELFLNERSLGIHRKDAQDFHLMWRVAYEPGIIKAAAKDHTGHMVLREIRTAGEPAAIQLTADRPHIHADGCDLSFITVKVVDQNGTLSPHADNMIHFEIEGAGCIAGVDNGHQISHEPFKANYRRAFNGMCLVVIQSTEIPDTITLQAKSEKLQSAEVTITSL
jgi:beta-galactosidase